MVQEGCQGGGGGGGVSFFAIIGKIRTMVDGKDFWVEISPPLVRKASHAMLGKKPVRDIRGR